jgi:hypothetical protein
LLSPLYVAEKVALLPAPIMLASIEVPTPNCISPPADTAPTAQLPNEPPFIVTEIVPVGSTPSLEAVNSRAMALPRSVTAQTVPFVGMKLDSTETAFEMVMVWVVVEAL